MYILINELDKNSTSINYTGFFIFLAAFSALCHVSVGRKLWK